MNIMIMNIYTNTISITTTKALVLQPSLQVLLLLVLLLLLLLLLLLVL